MEGTEYEMVVTGSYHTVEPLSEAVRPLTKESALRAIQFVTLIPNGIVNMNGVFQGVVESSNNLGILHIADGRLEAVCEERGQYQTTIDNISRKINLLVELLGGKTEFFSKYAPWEYAHISPLRELACRVYREQFEDELHVLSLHAGLECGMFAAKKENLDILSIGPNCENFHSVSEKLSISSARKFFRFLLAVLENLK